MNSPAHPLYLKEKVDLFLVESCAMLSRTDIKIYRAAGFLPFGQLSSSLHIFAMLARGL